MKKIGIDCRFASTHSGSGRYTRGLVPELLAASSSSFCLFVKSNNEEWISTLPNNIELIEAPFDHYSFAEQLSFPRLIRSSGIDLYFSTQFNIPVLCSVPFVAVVHDLILHSYPNQASFCKQAAYRIVMNRTVQRSLKLIAVSEFTASEICNVYGKHISSKVHVVTEGVEDTFRKIDDQQVNAIQQSYGIQKPYFLYVGNSKEHKNVQVLIDAYTKLDASENELLLVGGGLHASDLQLCDGVRILNDVADEHLPALYSGALSFVTASLYEGFGLPVIEARKCGCKVIAANTSALPEAAEGNALLIEPTVDAFVSAMQNLDSVPEPQEPTGNWKDVAQQIASILDD